MSQSGMLQRFPRGLVEARVRTQGELSPDDRVSAILGLMGILAEDLRRALREGGSPSSRLDLLYDGIASAIASARASAKRTAA